MKSKHPDQTRSATPDALSKTLASLVRWPESWKATEADIPLGLELVEIFSNFLTELYLQGLSTRTINRHRGNLWVLGGEVIRRRSSQLGAREMGSLQILADYVSNDGGPLLFLGSTDAEQSRFDGTCRQLSDFLPQTTATKHAPNTDA